jgi:hypothetical protein
MREREKAGGGARGRGKVETNGRERESGRVRKGERAEAR